MEKIIAELKVQAECEQKKIQSKHSELKTQLSKAEQRVSELRADIFRASGSEQRLRNFQPFLNEQFQCPRCWVVNGTQADLKLVGSKENDIVKCSVKGCGFYASVPA